jgi:hypothetical protein
MHDCTMRYAETRPAGGRFIGGYLMTRHFVPAPVAARRNSLATCIAALLGFSAPASYATTVVTNCNDAGPGSLRAAVASAPTGDTIDASGLAGICSTITLKTGAISVTQTDLTIKGKAPDKLAVTAKYSNGSTHHQYQNRLFTHTGTGTLWLQDMSLNKGYQASAAGAANGGCVSSNGNVILYRINAGFCSTHTTSGSAAGGAVYAAGNLLMKYSNLNLNVAYGGTSGRALGGAVMSHGNLLVKYSTMSGNMAYGGTGNVTGFGGAIYSSGSTGSSTIGASTISGNSSGKVFGGIGMFGNAGAALTIQNSTISGNAAKGGAVGGVYAKLPLLGVYNSTIAFNTATSGDATAGAGLAITAYSPSYGSMAAPGTSATIASSIFSNNSYAGSSSDLSTANNAAATVTITGNTNLVRVSTASLPGDTITGKCPLLKPLKNNGGLTQTHGLYGHSPAIDHGSNASGFHEDQRGEFSDASPYPHPRESGPPGGAAVADIGAFEVNQADEIYDSSFEGC